MSDGSIKIIGDLKFIGYKQTAAPGTNRQVLTYIDGKAVWNSLGIAASITTAPSSQGVIIDRDGNVVVSELSTYIGIDTKPSLRVLSNSDDFVENFNSSTDWTEDTGTGEFFIDFLHELSSDDIIWDIYDNSNTGILLQPTKQSNVRLRITLNDTERFAGRIYIERAQ